MLLTLKRSTLTPPLSDWFHIHHLVAHGFPYKCPLQVSKVTWYRDIERAVTKELKQHLRSPRADQYQFVNI